MLNLTLDFSPSGPFQTVHPNRQVKMPRQPRTAQQLEIFDSERPVDGHIHQDRQDEEGNALKSEHFRGSTYFKLDNNGTLLYNSAQ